MRVLIAWGSKLGGTEGIGRLIAETLEQQGFEVVAVSADRVKRDERFDAAIIGGALYANRWPGKVRRFVQHHVAELRRVPVWFFSSGPLDDSADRKNIPPPDQIGVLAERVGAREHVTFGGRLEPDVRGFPARAMAKTNAGDWRNPDRIRAWANKVALELPNAVPGAAIDHPARSVARILGYGGLGWLLCAGLMGALLAVASATVAVVLHAIAAPLIFTMLAWRYFRARGARDPLPTAVTWTTLVVLLDLAVVAGLIQGSLAMFAGIAGTWLPLALVLFAVWGTGALMSTMPWPKPDRPPQPPERFTKAAPASKAL